MKQVPDRKQPIRNRRSFPNSEQRSELDKAIIAWIVTVFVCLMVWAVVSPIFYETVVMGNGAWVLGIGACILVPIIVASVSSTGKVVRKAREQYFPPLTPDEIPADEMILVRGSEEPPVAPSEVLLRAAKEQETSKEELLRV